MKRVLYTAQVILLGLFGLSVLILLLQFTGNSNPFTKFDNAKPSYNNVEKYDPSLARLTNLEKLEQYCDSLYVANGYASNQENFEENYTILVSSVVSRRFYHGYSYYGFKDNYLAFLFSKVTNPGYSAVVVPNDILKFPFAACSQQSIVMMELLRAKGLKTRKISFLGKVAGGHFCFEVFYNNSWHFFDPNMEPDVAVLNVYNRPGIAFLVNHPNVLLEAYRLHPKETILDIFPTYSYGEVDKFPAPTAIVFHKVTKALSYTIWIFLLGAFLLVRRIYKRLISNQYVRNSRIYFPQPEQGTSSSYYPGLTAPGA
jgi:hypothetical protein